VVLQAEHRDTLVFYDSCLKDLWGRSCNHAWMSSGFPSVSIVFLQCHFSSCTDPVVCYFLNFMYTSFYRCRRFRTLKYESFPALVISFISYIHFNYENSLFSHVCHCLWRIRLKWVQTNNMETQWLTHVAVVECFITTASLQASMDLRSAVSPYTTKLWAYWA
jgi:hypothetical protein